MEAPRVVEPMHFRMDAESSIGGSVVDDWDHSGCESDDLSGSADDPFHYVENAGPLEASWARDRRELEASKLSFLRVSKEQQQVDESVRLLLRRLDELPAQTLK